MPDLNFGAMLDDAAAAAGKPLQATPEAFVQHYGPAADRVASKTGIDSNTILGQWGLETGWGKSIIPGTNNLGNIKATKASGAGVKAVDNQTGSNDAYQKFDSVDDFADGYANLINSRYKDALHTGTDAEATAKALKAGGYAEDKDYISKVTSAAALATKARGGSTNYGALLDSLPQNFQDPNSDVTGTTETLQKYPGYQKQPESGGIVSGFAGGVGEGLGKTVLGAQALAGKGLQAVGAQQAGDWLVNDAQQGNRNLTQQADQAAGSHNWARTAGNITGAVAPALVAGPELLPQIAVGAEYGAGNAALNNQPILPATVEGAGLGAAGVAGGKALGAASAAVAPVARRLLNSATGGENAVASKLAGQLGGELDSTINALRTNSDEIIPGSLPTAAEAANNPVIARAQRQYQNTETGQEAFPARQASNAQARIDTGRGVVGPDIEGEAAQFTQQQAQRVAAGQKELPPVSPEQNAVMQSPAYQKAINLAQRDAQNAGVTAFEDAAATRNAGLANDLEQVTGTQAELEAARAARSTEAARNYGAISGEVPLGNDATDLLARDGVRSAIASAAKNDRTRLGLAAPDGLSTIKPKVAPVLGNDGANQGFKVVEPGSQSVSAKTLVGAKALLSDDATQASRLGRANDSDIAGQAKNALHSFLTDNVPAYRKANDAYMKASEPIDQMTALQKRLTNAVNPLTGEVNPKELVKALASIQREQLKPGLQQADRLTAEKLSALENVAKKAADSVNSTTGVSGQGQEFLRKALGENAKKLTGQLDGEAAVKAKQAFDQYLAEHSPSYKKFLDVQSGYGQDLASRQALSEGLDKLTNVANSASGVPNVTFNAAKNTLGKAGLTGAAQEYTGNLLADLQRSTTANAQLGAAGSQTFANQAIGSHGLLGGLLHGHTGSAGLGILAGAGHLPAAALGAVVKKASAAAAAKSEKAAIDLLLNPKKLADALESYKNQPKAREVFVEALKSKAMNSSGKAGQRAVQAYNSRNS
jgi:flagellum-specific peptidoglycan hydrolase FlgJ